MSVSPLSESEHPIFVGNSKMARLMQAHDWASTPLGPPEAWPEGLKSAIRLLLTSRFEMWLGWGPDITFFYNDAYIPTLGLKHPEALGKPTQELWREIWPDVGPRLKKVYERGEATWDRALQLILLRSGFPEETYHTFSYSPLFGDDGKVEGVFCAVSEDTDRIISERRLATLQELASGLAMANSRAAVLSVVERTLPTNPQDLTFSLVYLFEADGDARLAATAGIGPEHLLAPDSLAGDGSSVWNLGDLWSTNTAEVIEIPNRATLPTGAWDVPSTKAALVPLVGQGTERPVGAMIVGLNPFRPPDGDYLDFLKLLAGQIASSLASAQAHEAERQRTAALAEAAHLRQAAAEALRRANEQLLSEVKLRTQERDRLRHMFEQAPSFMCIVTGKDHVIELANEAYCQLVGRRDLVGKTGREAVPELIEQGFFEIMDRVLETGEPFVGRDIPVLLQRTPDGPLEERIVNTVYQPVFQPDGEVLGIFVEGHDVTDQKRAEEELQRLNETLEQRVAQRTEELADALERLRLESEERAAAEAALRQAQKLEALGKLTGGIAHDFNNLLQVVSGNLQLLGNEVRGNEKAERRINSALAGVARGAKLASQLLAFGRRQPLEPKVVNIGRFIMNMDDMLRRALGEETEIETVIAGGLWNTLVDPGQIENALLNLALNGRDAMDGHGRLTIEARNAMLDDEYARQHDEVKPGQYVMIAVTDTGSGIAPEIMDRVFEPFFSTKPEGQGSGLGLSMVHGFVKQSGGHIKIYSELGEGTTVRIYLPRVYQDEDVLIDTSNTPVRGGTETILVVEDDDEVRETTAALLKDLGYRVLKARDAVSALNVIESGIAIDLLFTDVVMPGPIRSPELARKAVERLPNIAVLFTSGYTENAIVHGGRLDAGVELLSKPYTREALARKIRHVLNNNAQRLGIVAPAEEASKGGEQPTTGKAERPRALTVLLVEDEGLIRAWTAEILSDLGHAVLEAGDAEAALQTLDTATVDLLLTDVGLPTATGVELAHQALLRHPNLQVIFSSGGDAVPALPGLGRFPTLLKPYTAEDLAAALSAVTASADGDDTDA